MALRPAAILVALLLGVLTGCSADDPLTLDPVAAVLRLELGTCTGAATLHATAVVISDFASPLEGTVVALTVAHPFVDDDGVFDVASLAVHDRDGQLLESRLVWIDAERDLALLEVRSAIDGLPIDERSGLDQVEVLGFDNTDLVVVQVPVEVERQVGITLDGGGERLALELSGRVEPGNSGAPVVNQDGQVVGLVFAATRTGGGWATDAGELDALATADLRAVDLVCGVAA